MRTRLETPRGRLLDLREERERLLCVWRGRTGRCRAVELNSFKNHQQHRTEHQFINCSTWTSTSALQFLSLEFESFRIQSVWYFLPTLTFYFIQIKMKFFVVCCLLIGAAFAAEEPAPFQDCFEKDSIACVQVTVRPRSAYHPPNKVFLFLYHQIINTQIHKVITPK